MRVCPSTARPIDQAVQKRPQAAHPLTGAVLDGKYLVGRVIGQGAAGIVFEGQNVVLRRSVAIKIVRNPERQGAFERLRREAEIIAALRHPNVCDIYDLGWLEHVGPFLVTERLQGETIAERLRTIRAFSLRDATSVIEQILSALQEAHSRQIVHRDLKPGNIFLVDRLGCGALAKILDFGLAKDFSAVSRSNTRPGRLVGTLEYMSPEQLRAEPASASSDLFAVAVVMYEMLCGRHPFAGRSTLEVQARILRDDPDPMTTPGSNGPPIPRPVEDFLRRALSKPPEGRFRQAMAMQAELRRAAMPLLRDVSTLTEPSSTRS